MNGFWYLATTYTRHPLGRGAAFRMACRVTARLMRAGVPVFSPIAHGHPVAEHGGIDPTDHDIWMQVDRPMMAAARGLIVFTSDGWQQSRGIAAEVETFASAGKPIVLMSAAEPLTIPQEVLRPLDLGDRLTRAAGALLADIRRRHPGEALRCPLMQELEAALLEVAP